MRKVIKTGTRELFFFYGTLMDARVRYRVLGRRLARSSIMWGQLNGFARLLVSGRNYPMVRSHPGGRVPGLLVRGLSVSDVRKLDEYEGDEYYRASIQVQLRSGKRIWAHTYLCHPQVKVSHRHWTAVQGVLRSRSFCQ